MIAAHLVPKDYAAALQVSQGKATEVSRAKLRVKAVRDVVCDASLEYLEAADAVAALGPGGHPSPDMDRQIRRRLEHATKDLRECHARVKTEEALLAQAEAELQEAAGHADRVLG